MIGKKQIPRIALLLCVNMFFWAITGNAQGTWIPLTNEAPDYNHGVMLLLTDGSVMVKTSAGGPDRYGTTWDRLTPDIHGSYVNGTWQRTTPMYSSRLYFSTQVLKDGSVYVAGGEYGTGRTRGEIYYPSNDMWLILPSLALATDTISDANSEILPDGTVLQAIVKTANTVSKRTYIYDPVSFTYTVGPPTLGYANESAWIKLKDNSILFVDINSTNAERYIPATNTWISDAAVPLGLYDPYGYEMGAAILLPDGRAFFIGSTSKTAYYTPSGTTAPGTWTAGPVIPDSLGAPDAAAAMMVNGKVLCAFSHTPALDSVFHKPMTFYEFNYITNTFTKLTAPDGKDSTHAPAYFSNMVCLPDGNILYGCMGTDQYYIYKPDGTPLPAGKPTLNEVWTSDCMNFRASGTLFNGITEGAGYGDDWQMATNYPIIRLISQDTVIYGMTTNWNSTGVCRGALPDSTDFYFPTGIPSGNFSIQVVVNGNASDALPFNACGKLAANNVTKSTGKISLNPNPADKMVDVVFDAVSSGDYNLRLADIYGRIILEKTITATAGENTYNIPLDGVSKGVYNVIIRSKAGMYNTKLVVK